MGNQMIRIVLADDHTIVRNALTMLLNHQPDIEVIGTAANSQEAYDAVAKLKPDIVNSQEAYDAVAKLKPDIVMLDISMPPGESGVITAGKIHADFPEVKIIMLTMHADKEYLLYTVQTGVSGYLLKNVPEEELIEAVHTVYGGSDYISKEMVPHLVDGFVNRHEEGKSGYLSLRERELEVLSLIARGYGNKEIGEKLFISVKTVESYRAKIMNKLGLRTRAELVEYALKKKLLQ